MTLAITSTRNDYVGSGAASVFNYTFPISGITQLVAYVVDPLGSPHLLTFGVDFDVAGVGQADGGTVTLVNSGQAWLTGGGNLATGYLLTLIRIQSLIQQTSIRNQGAYFPEVIESEFDDIVMKLQQLAENLSRTVQAPIADGALGQMPPKAQRANLFLGFDSSGNPIASASVSSSLAATALGLVVVQGRVVNITAAQSPYTAQPYDRVINADTSAGAVTVNLPAVSGNAAGVQIEVVKTTSDGNAVTVTPSGTDNFLGANASQTISNQWTSLRCLLLGALGWIN